MMRLTWICSKGLSFGESKSIASKHGLAHQYESEKRSPESQLLLLTPTIEKKIV